MKIGQYELNNNNLPEILTSNKTAAYLKFMADVAEKFGTNSSNVTQEISRMFDFEIELSKVET